MTRGPNSFVEWVVGRNLPSAPQRPRGPQRVARLDWSADEDSGEDTVALTVPRRHPPRPKKVRFEEAEPRKSVLKLPSAVVAEEPVGEASDATTETDTTGSEANTEEDSGSDCPCSKCDNQRKKKQEKIDEATHAKHKQRKAKKARATVHDKNKKTPEADSDTTVESGSDAPKQHKAKGKKKNNKLKKARVNGPKAHSTRNAKKGTSHVLDDTETSDDTERSDADEKPRKKNKRKEKREKKKAKEKTAKLPPYPPSADIRQPELLLPVSSSVLQIEHAVEAADDPKPNAFYDPVNGVMRMYHGPAYANPYGRLYPKRTYNHQPLPVGVPHPTNNPWYYGFASGQAQHPADGLQMAPAPKGPPVNPPMTPAPPAPAPPGAKQWFQGYGTAVVGGGDGDASPSASAAERKKTKAATGNPAPPLDVPAPPNKPSSNRASGSAGSKTPLDTKTLWRDGQPNPSSDANCRGNKTWGAHDSKGINDFLERLSAKYSNSPKSNNSRSPDKGGSQKAGSNGWRGAGIQTDTGDWNNDNNNTTNQWSNSTGNENTNWNNGNDQRGNNTGNENQNWDDNNNNNNNSSSSSSSNYNNGANNHWSNNNGNETSNFNQGDHTNVNNGDWSAPNNSGGGNTSNGNWNVGGGSHTGSNDQWNSGEQADNNWGASGRQMGNNDNNDNANWDSGNGTGQTGTDWENTANDQANNHVAGNWSGNNRNRSEHGGNCSARSNTHQPTNHGTPPGAWPDDRQAQASPRRYEPSTGGNVVGASDEWGDNEDKGGDASWQDTGAAQSTKYWDNEGKGTEQDTTGPNTGGKRPWWG